MVMEICYSNVIALHGWKCYINSAMLMELHHIFGNMVLEVPYMNGTQLCNGFILHYQKCIMLSKYTTLMEVQ